MTEPIAFTGATPRLALPLLFAGQSQKEFYVNEALLRADLAVQCAVEGEVQAPPPDAQPGQAWLVGDSPTGAFAGHARAIAGWTESGWRFIVPQKGYRVYDRDVRCFRHFLAEWSLIEAPASPAGGGVIDQQARVAIAAIVERLVDAGIFAAS